MAAEMRIHVERPGAAPGPNIVDAVSASAGKIRTSRALSRSAIAGRSARAPVSPPNRMRRGSSGARRTKSTLKFQSTNVRPPGRSFAASSSGNGSVAIIAIERDHPAVEPGHQPAGIAIGGDEHVARQHRAMLGRDLEAAAVAGDGGDRRLSTYIRSGALRPLEQALMIEPGMKPAMIGDDGAAEIARRVDLGSLRVAAEHRELLAEMRLAQLELPRHPHCAGVTAIMKRPGASAGSRSLPPRRFRTRCRRPAAFRDRPRSPAPAPRSP